MIDALLQRECDQGARKYLNVLTDMVEAYEDEHVEIRDASEADVLRELMSANRLSQPKLAKAVAIAHPISAVLNGSRSLTKDQVVAARPRRTRYRRLPSYPGEHRSLMA